MSEWISVKDRLPDDGECYFVHTPDCDPPYQVSLYEGGRWFPDVAGITPLPGVRYWMPIPDPPQLHHTDLLPRLRAALESEE